jgi:glyoxylase-like metal-dependent hydrolase (beta-lactamase superfamily II)
MSMRIEAFELPPIGTNAYFIWDAEREEAVVVDAPLNAFATIEKRLVETGCKLTALLMTHAHWDHLLDGWRFNAFDTPVYGHRDDEPLFTEPNRMGRFAFGGIEMKPMAIQHWLEDGQEISLLGRKIEARHVPGHCPGSLLFWFKDEGVAFAGDAIFNGGIGRYDLPGGSFEILEKSIRERIYTLPPNTVLYPGHGPETSVEREMAANPFVRPV